MSSNEFSHGAPRAVVLSLSGLLLVAFGVAQAQPANDDCETATVIPSSAPPYTDTVDSTTATLDPDDPLLSCNTGDDGDNTIWYEWTPDTSGTVNITTDGSTESNGSELDTAHGMYTGSCGQLVEFACVDFGLNDDLIVDVTAGTTYKIKVGEFAGGVGGGEVVLSVEPPPEPDQFVIESSRFGESPPISTLVGPVTPRNPADKATALEVPNPMLQQVRPGPSNGPSPGSMIAGEKAPLLPPPVLLQSFDGGENEDNADVFGFYIAPPDTIGDVGISHYVQMFNLLTEIFDKSGNSVLGPFPTSVFWTGMGGACEFDNLGDPIVLYDEETDRWMVTQFQGFNSPGFQLCVAVSTSGDPTDTWYQYEFDFSAIGFPDYPKYGFATDSISLMANIFEPFQGAGIGVIDKAEAFSSGPATMVFFTLGGSQFGHIPGDNDGPVFDNMPPTFFTNNGTSGNAIDVWEITPDYATPENTTVAEVQSIEVGPFDTDLCSASREACIPQPGSGTGAPPDNITFLEAIADRMMHRAQLRDFGEGKAAVLSHTVDADGNGRAGVRWYIFGNRDDGQGWFLRRSNTFAPGDENRWMGSIAMRASGGTCLGYSISSETTFPSIGITGRKGVGNFMNYEESVVFDGNVAANVQRRTARWGDYSSMNIDPVDDTCWFTTEYAKPTEGIGEQFGWATKVIQVRLPTNPQTGQDQH